MDRTPGTARPGSERGAARRYLLSGVVSVAAMIASAIPGDASPAAFAAVPVALGYAYGEPGIVVDTSVSPAITYMIAPGLDGGQVWRSTDGGSSFEPAGNLGNDSSDEDIAVDADGVVYVVDYGDQVRVSRSHDRGETFAHTVLPGLQPSAADRPWIAARGHDEVLVTFVDWPYRIISYVSRDAGRTFSGPHLVLAPSGGSTVQIGTLTTGPVTVGPDGTFWAALGDLRERRVVWARSDDGATWTSGPVAPIEHSYATSTSPLTAFPVMAAGTDGSLHVAWATTSSQERATTSAVFLSSSYDGGSTWSAPTIVSDPTRSAVFPWVVAGDTGRVAVAFLQASDALPPDSGTLLTSWDAVLVHASDARTPGTYETVVVLPRLHYGGICTGGNACWNFEGQPAGIPYDRRLLDFFEVAIDERGAPILALATDPRGGGTVDLVAARQVAGTPLLARSGS